MACQGRHIKGLALQRAQKNSPIRWNYGFIKFSNITYKLLDIPGRPISVWPVWFLHGLQRFQLSPEKHKCLRYRFVQILRSDDRNLLSFIISRHFITPNTAYCCKSKRVPELAGFLNLACSATWAMSTVVQ